ncbi:spermidine hydroxycinnamoyl transferase-like [Cucurbita moschata]|uniref:Spermidine hydroxycinnamoyl transferase-like n=1 Tax=Cucurbita moschata TaxID=3662 RepID=A0A6J1EB80_CUCMO|nr:spermidine hydroxycinnamoyl transferase-like [Cucurbita moschata]
MASITIHSSSTVIPSHPTPTGAFSVSECDQYRAWTHLPSVYVYKSPAAEVIIVESLKTSLSQILVPFYPLAGRLHWLPGGRLELDCCAAGALFVEASTNAKLEDYGDFAPSDAVRELVPSVDYNSPIEELPLLLFQVTRFSCGGVVIGVANCHTVVDGASAVTFINSWASMARGEKTVETILQPLHDRKFLMPEKPLRPPRFDHVEFTKPPPLILGSSNTEEEAKKETTSALLKLTKEQIEKLKKRANSNLTNQTMDVADEVQPRPYSRFEAITGHMWVCACKARNTGESRQPTVIRIPIDVRRRMKPPIPENFSGNSSFVVSTPECEFGELMSQPLSYAAGKIREGTWKMTGEYAQSAVDYLAGQDDFNRLRTSFHSKVPVQASFWGNPNLSIGSWMSFPFYEADFGWGRPSYFTPATLNTDGKSYIMVGPSDDGSLIIAIRLQTRHMDDFKKYLYEDI